MAVLVGAMTVTYFAGSMNGGVTTVPLNGGSFTRLGDTGLQDSQFLISANRLVMETLCQSCCLRALKVIALDTGRPGQSLSAVVVVGYQKNMPPIEVEAI